jgi:prevent-host-death family protein
MDRIIGVTELQRKFRFVFAEVARRRIPYILTRGSQPEVVLLPYEQYLRYIRADEAGVVKRVNRVLARLAAANARYSDKEIETDLRQATKTLRARKRKS